MSAETEKLLGSRSNPIFAEISGSVTDAETERLGRIRVTIELATFLYLTRETTAPNDETSEWYLRKAGWMVREGMKVEGVLKECLSPAMGH